MVLWCYCAEREAQIMSSYTRNIYSLQGMVPQSKLTGQPTDISNLIDFGFYEWCYYRDHQTSFPFPNKLLGRCLGPARTVGKEMCQNILCNNGNVLPFRTLRRLTKEELMSTTEKAKRQEFDESVWKRYGTAIDPPPVPLP